MNDWQEMLLVPCTKFLVALSVQKELIFSCECLGSTLEKSD